MSKSAEDFENVDYSDLPEEVKKVVRKSSETLEKQAKISYDGKQHIIRIPTAISNALDIKKGDKVTFTAILPPASSEKDDKLQLKYERQA